MSAKGQKNRIMRRIGSYVFTGSIALGAMLASAAWRDDLPRPVFDAEPGLVDFYYKAWELAHNRIDELPGLPAPRYMDEAVKAADVHGDHETARPVSRKIVETT